MDEQVKQLKEEIEQLDLLQESVKEKKIQFEKSIEKETSQIDGLKKNIQELKDSIEKKATDYFRETNEKNYFGGIKIQEVKTLTYSPEKAFSWAKEHSLCLALDVKAFEKLAESQDFDFIVKEKNLRATFPKVIKLEENKSDESK